MGDRDLKEIKKHPLPAARFRGDRWTVLDGVEANPELWELTGRRASWRRWLGTEVVQEGFLEEVAWRRCYTSIFLKGEKGDTGSLVCSFQGVGADQNKTNKQKQSGQDVRLGPQTLTDFRALCLINGLNTLARAPGKEANSCWGES